MICSYLLHGCDVIRMFSNLTLINKKSVESLKSPTVLKIWGRERGKMEGPVGKLSQNSLFSNFPHIFIVEGKVWSKNMQLRVSQPFRGNLAVFPLKGLEK